MRPYPKFKSVHTPVNFVMSVFVPCIYPSLLVDLTIAKITGVSTSEIHLLGGNRLVVFGVYT